MDEKRACIACALSMQASREAKVLAQLRTWGQLDCHTSNVNTIEDAQWLAHSCSPPFSYPAYRGSHNPTDWSADCFLRRWCRSRC